MTKKEESRIRSMRKSGKSIKAIAKTLHIGDKSVSKVLKTVPASNKISVPTKGANKVKTLKPIDLMWHNGAIVKANRTPAELLVFGHAVITFALGEIVKGLDK